MGTQEAFEVGALAVVVIACVCVSVAHFGSRSCGDVAARRREYSKGEETTGVTGGPRGVFGRRPGLKFCLPVPRATCGPGQTEFHCSALGSEFAF